MICPLCQTGNPAQSQRCRACGAPLKSRAAESVAAPDALANGTLLAGTYAVEDVLGQGGFGITYSCHDQILDRRVAVKEFFPSGCRRQDAEVAPARGLSDAGFREARAQFLAEARTLARCHHVGIVGVHAAFEANSTAYMVMELLHGKTLSQLLSARGGAMNEAEAVGIIERVGEALQFVHYQNLLHRDIKPDNIIVCDDGRVMLIDFGTARETIQDVVQGQTVMVTPGYAPLEQYARQAKRGPFTDVYSLAATLYQLLTGQMPPAASDRALGVQLRDVRETKPQISASVAFATQSALQMEIAKRPQSVREFLDLLHAPVEQAEEFFHPQLAKLPFDDDDDEDLADDEIPAALTPDAIRARQSSWPHEIAPVDPQPVKIAPPRAFSTSNNSPKAAPVAANAPKSAPTPANPPSSSLITPGGSGGVNVQNTSDSNDAAKALVWIITVLAVIFGFVYAISPRGSRIATSSSSYPIENVSPPSVYSPPFDSAPDTSQNDSKRRAALQAWDALPSLAPASINDLPVSANAATAPMNLPYEGNGIEFSLDGKRLAYIDGKAVLRVLSLPDRAVVRSLQLDPKYPPIDVLFAPDNQIIAVREKMNTSQAQNAIRTEVWSVQSGKRMGVFDRKAATEYNLPFAVTNEGQLLSWNSSDTTGNYDLSSWNPKTRKITATAVVTSNTAALGYGVTSPNGKRIVVGDTLGRLRWFERQDGKQIVSSSTLMSPEEYSTNFGKPYRGTGNYPPGVLGIDYSLNGQFLASRNHGEITVFDSKANKISSLVIENTSMFFSMSPDGNWLAAVGSLPFSPKGTLLWNVKTGREIRLQTPNRNMCDFGFSQDGQQLYGIFSDNAKLQFVTWNVDEKAVQKPRLFSRENDYSLELSNSATKTNIAVSQSAQEIAIASANSIEINYHNRSVTRTSSHLKPVATAFSPNGKLLVVRGRNNVVQLWNASNGEIFSELAGVTTDSQTPDEPSDGGKDARLMAFSADNNLLAFARSSGDIDVVELWSVSGAPRRLASLKQQEPVNALTFSPDNKALICGGEKGLLQWFDVKTGKSKSQSKTGEPIFDLAFAARNLVVMGESNSTLYRVPANAADPLQKATRTKLASSFDTGRDVYTPATISPDGKLLATAQGYNDFQIWELPSGRKLQSLQNGQGSSVTQTSALSFSADSTAVTSVWQTPGNRAVTVSTYRRAQSE